MSRPPFMRSAVVAIRRAPVPSLADSPDVSTLVFGINPDEAARISITRHADAGGFDLVPESATDPDHRASLPGWSLVGNVRLAGPRHLTTSPCSGGPPP